MIIFACFHHAVKYINDIRKQKKILKEYRSHLQRSKGHEVMYDTVDPKAMDKHIDAANNALDEAEEKIREINESGLEKISAQDLSLLLRDLGHPCSPVSSRLFQDRVYCRNLLDILHGPIFALWKRAVKACGN